VNPYIEKRRHKEKRFYTGFRLYYHFVSATKHRLPLLVGEARRSVGQTLVEECKKRGHHLLEIAVMPDHIHLLLSLKPTDYLPEVIQHLKETSSRMYNATNPDTPMDWTDGYGVDTVGKTELLRIKHYIANQREELKAKGLDWYLETRHLEAELGPLPGKKSKKDDLL